MPWHTVAALRSPPPHRPSFWNAASLPPSTEASPVASIPWVGAEPPSLSRPKGPSPTALAAPHLPRATPAPHKRHLLKRTAGQTAESFLNPCRAPPPLAPLFLLALAVEGRAKYTNLTSFLVVAAPLHALLTHRTRTHTNSTCILCNNTRTLAARVTHASRCPVVRI